MVCLCMDNTNGSRVFSLFCCFSKGKRKKTSAKGPQARAAPPPRQTSFSGKCPKHLPFHMLGTFRKLSVDHVTPTSQRGVVFFVVVNMNSPSVTSERRLFTAVKEDKVTALPPSHLPLNTGNPCSKEHVHVGARTWCTNVKIALSAPARRGGGEDR